MKKTVVALSLCLSSMLGVAFAQAGNLLTVKLPHAANIGSTTLPAGEYTVRELQANGNAAALEISSRTGPSVSFIATEVLADTDRTSDRTHVVLKSDGETLQVDKIWIAGRTAGFQVVR